MKAIEGAGAVAFEGQDVFAGPEDSLDALADRREVRAVAALVLAARPDHGGVEFARACGEVSPYLALVTEQCLTAGAPVLADLLGFGAQTICRASADLRVDYASYVARRT